MIDLDAYIQSVQGLKTLFLVHGEEEGMSALAQRMKQKNAALNVIMPEKEMEYDLGV
jgi:hypothetical protein